MNTDTTQTHHSTEALARKAARRHGRVITRIIEGVPNPGAARFWVETGEPLLSRGIWPGEKLVYQGEGRKA